MNNCFKTIFEGYELLLPKNSVIFKNGAGIVNAYFKMEYDNLIIDEPLIGIVDENYNFIIDMFPKRFIRNINLFPNDIIIQYTEKLTDNDVYVFLIPKDDLKTRYNLLANDYQVVDENLLILKSIDDEIPICTLFDINNKQLLTPYYNYIGEFKTVKGYDENVAIAYFYIRNEYKEIISKIEFYINKKGKVVSVYRNTMTNDTYDNSLDFEHVLELVKSDILNCLKLVK